MIGPALERRGFRYVVVTLQRDEVDALRRRGIPAIYGDAVQPRGPRAGRMSRRPGCVIVAIVGRRTRRG